MTFPPYVLDPAVWSRARQQSPEPGWPDDTGPLVEAVVRDLETLPGLRIFRRGPGSCCGASYTEISLTHRDDPGEEVVELRPGRRWRPWRREVVTRTTTTGFAVLLSHLAPLAAIVGGVRETRDTVAGSRRDSGSLSQGPCVDLPVPGYPRSAGVRPLLAAHGFHLIDAEVLRRPVPPDQAPPSLLAPSKPCVFDAWFYWYC